MKHFLTISTIWILLSFLNWASAAEFRAGAVALDISPRTLPAIRNGGFLQAVSDRVDDPLHARCLVLSDGNETVAIVIVDSCMFPTDICDAIKARVSEQIGLRQDRILISATHTHSAPSVMAYCLGTGRDEAYTEFVVPRVAQAIIAAHRELRPAKIGWTAMDLPEYTNCRRWITRRDRVADDPFGRRTVRAMMHPGYLNPNYVSPSGPIDPQLSVVSIVSAADQPICVMANYSMHYFGGTAGFSADYFGQLASNLESHFGNASDDSAFVGIMSQGTSGDLHWMDYSRPQRKIARDEYAKLITDKIITSQQAIEHHGDVTLAMAETRLKLQRRLPSLERLAWAKPINEERGDRPPRSQIEVYAQQAEWIDANRNAEVVLQAVKIGELAITALPCEVYGITGLKLKQQSPLKNTFNLELANGAEGYIPPPEQHLLGGYTTWPARSAGLEETAEPKIVESVLSLLETVSGKSRRPLVDPGNEYSRSVLNADPVAYWRLGDLSADKAVDTMGNHHAKYEGAVALHLPGPSANGFGKPSANGFGKPSANGFGKPSANGFGSSTNRCVYFAGGHLEVSIDDLPSEYSVSFWFWSGLPGSARSPRGTLFARGTGKEQESLSIVCDDTGMATLAFHTNTGQHNAVQHTGTTPLATEAWHHVTLVRTDRNIAIFLDGQTQAEISAETALGAAASSIFFVAGNGDSEQVFDGKFDDVAIFGRAISSERAGDLYRVSGMTAPRRPDRPIGLREKRSDSESLKKYAEEIAKSQPVAYWRLHDADNQSAHELIGKNNGRYEPHSGPRQPGSTTKNFSGGRAITNLPGLGNTYSVELWIRNELPVTNRPVTGYIFTRGIDGANGAPGDCFGIGGTHSWTGRLFVFNGNQRSDAVSGTTTLAVASWNHVVMVREEENVKVFLNGNLEIDDKLPITYPASCDQIQIGGRNDNFANFQGMIDEVAVYDRALHQAEIRSHFQAGSAEPITRPKSTPPTEPQPTSPSDSLNQIHIRPGYEVQLVASEPLISDPVAIDWGHDGTLWVVEMADYPLGMDGQGKPGGRIRVLKDSDDDGQYDQSSLFADGISFPTGILTWGKGVLITAAPEILYLEDTTGDGKADRRRTLYTGFLAGNQQLRVNGLRLGLDGWVYCASGSHHAGYGKASQIKSAITGESVPVGSRDFRIRPDSGAIEAQSGPSQYGRNRDDWGNWFGVQNSHPLWHYVLADQDIRRNPHFAPPDPKRQVVTPINPRVYPAAKLQKRFHSFEQSGRFTSACSAMIYRDDLLFSRSDSQQHAFTCEPFHNLVQHNIISEDGVSFAFHRDPAESEFDFFASRDRWCRPVMARTGPDGGLWIVDMYRYMIEHPEWLPESGKNELRPYYRLGQHHGRIYRVVPKGRDVSKWSMRFTDLSTVELVATLESSNGWERDTAQRRLIRASDPASIGLLQQMVRSSVHPLARLHALSTLDGMHTLSVTTLETALADKHSAVRRHAVRLSDGRMVDIQKLNALVTDPDAKVRLQLAVTLGSQVDAYAAQILAELAVKSADDVYITANVMSSLHQENCADVLSQYSNRLADSKAVSKGQRDLQLQFFRQAAALVDAKAIGEIISLTCTPLEPQLAAWQRLGLAELLDGLGDRGFPLDQLPAQQRRLIDFAIDQARTSVSEPSAMRLLLRQPQKYDSDIQQLANLLVPQSAIDVQIAASNRLSEMPEANIARLMLEGWRSYGPLLRTHLFHLLASRNDWSRMLLANVVDGSVSVAEMSPAMRQTFLTTADKSLQAGWQDVFATKSSVDRRKVLDDFRSALQLPGDSDRGTKVFEKHCATCHRVGTLGHDVGPNLTSITDRRPEALLSSILDPSAAVEAKYLTYVLLTADGRAVNGLLAAETASSVTFLSVDGKKTTVLRKEIENLRATGKSFMPDGLEKNLNAQQIADLIQLLRN